MTTFDLNNMKEESGSDYFNFPQGKTKMRILTDFVKVEQVWKDNKPTPYRGGELEEGERLDRKGWCWAEVEGTLKIVKMPVSVIKQIGKLKQNPEYAWDEMPMPFDVTIEKTGEKVETRYSLEPARTNTEVSQETLDSLAEKTSIADIVSKMQEKQENAEVDKKFEEDYPEEDSGDVPF